MTKVLDTKLWVDTVTKTYHNIASGKFKCLCGNPVGMTGCYCFKKCVDEDYLRNLDNTDTAVLFAEYLYHAGSSPEHQKLTTRYVTELEALADCSRSHIAGLRGLTTTVGCTSNAVSTVGESPSTKAWKNQCRAHYTRITSGNCLCSRCGVNPVQTSGAICYKSCMGMLHDGSYIDSPVIYAEYLWHSHSDIDSALALVDDEKRKVICDKAPTYQADLRRLKARTLDTVHSGTDSRAEAVSVTDTIETVTRCIRDSCNKPLGHPTTKEEIEAAKKSMVDTMVKIVDQEMKPYSYPPPFDISFPPATPSDYTGKKISTPPPHECGPSASAASKPFVFKRKELVPCIDDMSGDDVCEDIRVRR